MPPRENFEVRLDDEALGPKTRREYNTALKAFLDYCDNKEIKATTGPEVDAALYEYMHVEFHTPGRDGRQHINKVICAIKHYMPEIRDQLHRSHRSLTGWARIRPSQQKTPCPVDITLGIAYYLRLRGNSNMALATLLTFDCCLRIQDIGRFEKKDVVLAAPPSKKVTLLMEQSKFGRNQSVPVRFNLTRELLVRRLALIQPRDRLFPFNLDKYRQSIHEVMASDIILNSPRFVITPHSFRHGGATYAYLSKALTVPEIQIRGRWNNAKTCEHYLQEGQYEYVQVQVNERSRIRLNEISSNPGAYFNVPEVRSDWNLDLVPT